MPIELLLVLEALAIALTGYVVGALFHTTDHGDENEASDTQSEPQPEQAANSRREPRDLYRGR